jgi:hypothetical protein
MCDSVESMEPEEIRTETVENNLHICIRPRVVFILAESKFS